MDGVLEAGAMFDPHEVAVTPVYCPPELAGALAQGARMMQVSRKMDVWSVGMSLLDCVLEKPLLQAQYAQDQEGFWDWLAGENNTKPSVWRKSEKSAEVLVAHGEAVGLAATGSGMPQDLEEDLEALVPQDLAEDLGALALPPEVFAFDEGLGRLLSQRV